MLIVILLVLFVLHVMKECRRMFLEVVIKILLIDVSSMDLLVNASTVNPPTNSPTMHVRKIIRVVYSLTPMMAPASSVALVPVCMVHTALE